MSPVNFKKCQCPCLCRLFMPMSHVEFKKWPCRMSNIRNGPVALSILGVKGHISAFTGVRNSLRHQALFLILCCFLPGGSIQLFSSSETTLTLLLSGTQEESPEYRPVKYS